MRDRSFGICCGVLFFLGVQAHFDEEMAKLKDLEQLLQQKQAEIEVKENHAQKRNTSNGRHYYRSGLHCCE